MLDKYLPRQNPELYEINTAAWLFELSRKLGEPVRLGEVPSAEWDRLKAWGMDLVWLMGIWDRSQIGRNVSLTDPGFHKLFDNIKPGWVAEDIIGSCYSIRAYEPDSLVGAWEDIDYVRDELHRRGMGLILDFIPNHTGIDHHWLTEHPEYYIQVSQADYEKDKTAFFPIEYNGHKLFIAHGRDPNFAAWTDTAQLNYFNPETRAAMIQKIEKIAPHCDGIRCDMAMLILNEVFLKVWGWTNKNPAFTLPTQEFWRQATRQVPQLVYIAEAYWDTEWTLQQLGFDFVYDKRLYDRLKSGLPQDVFSHLNADINYQKKLVRFIENHDELRSAAVFGRDKLKVAAALFAGLPGMKLFFQGQIEGMQIRLPLQIRQCRAEATDAEIKAFYEKLLPVVNEDIFHDGVWQLIEVSPDVDKTAENLVAYTWKLGDLMRLVIVNLDPHPARGRISLLEGVAESRVYVFTNRLSGQIFTQPGKLISHPGFLLKLEGYQAQIWEIEVS